MSTVVSKKTSHCFYTGCPRKSLPLFRVFPGPFTHGGTSAGDKALMGGGLMRGDIDLMGADLTLIDYIIN